jgi:hypothetical protein
MELWRHTLWATHKLFRACYCAAGWGIAVLGELMQFGAPLLATSALLKVE